MKPVHKLFFAVLLLPLSLLAQNGLVSTGNSPKAALNSVGISDVQWTKGFWAERFAVCRDAMLPQLWQTYTSKNMCYSFQNFRVAAGLDTGRFRGPSFHDGDFYKTLEAVAAMYASTKDAKLEAWMDEAIAVIGKAQKADGYIYTKNIIEQRKTGSEKMFDDQLSFEAYNFGHLMTAACVHYRATGKTTLLNIASKAADFLIGFYKTATPEQARNAICPSHYMGLTELYRTTQQKKYLDLVVHLINIRGTVEGTDDNSDRAPFRDMQKIAGHAVRANYLLAGVADVYAETGDASLLTTLHRLWNNVILSKMYVTGGCGALYDGVSVDGTSYKPDTVQKVHQSYGRDFQLPNLTAHNETCANIGNVLWNWRMFLLTGESKYTDIVELALYNSVLSGVSLEWRKPGWRQLFLYQSVGSIRSLSVSHALGRWPHSIHQQIQLLSAKCGTYHCRDKQLYVQHWKKGFVHQHVWRQSVVYHFTRWATNDFGATNQLSMAGKYCYPNQTVIIKICSHFLSHTRLVQQIHVACKWESATQCSRPFEWLHWCKVQLAKRRQD